MPQNPFFAAGPVPPEYFVGRKSEIRTAFDVISKQGHLAIYGSPGMGKSSFLRYLSSPEVWKAQVRDSKEAFIVYLNCTGINPFTPSAFWREILSLLKDETEGDTGLHSDIETVLQEESVEVAHLRRILRKLGNQKKFLVLLLDDYDAALLPNNDYTEVNMLSFLSEFRDLAVHRKEGRCLSTIVSTFRRLSELGPQLAPSGSPWYNHYLFLPLKSFPEDEVISLFFRGEHQYIIPISITLRSGVLAITGGHPALLQNAGYLLHEIHQEGKIPDVEAFTRGFQSRTEQFFKDAAIHQFFPYLQSIVTRQEKLFIIPVVGRQLEDMDAIVLGLFKEAPKQEIGLLNEQSAKRLITEPVKGVLEYNSNAIQAILELSAGHPYFTQLLCFELFSQVRSRYEQRTYVTRADVESIVEQAISIGEAGLTWFWNGLPIPEQVIFSAVAEAQSIASLNANPVIEEPLKLLGKYGVVQTEPLAQAGQRLVEWGFLDFVEGSDLPLVRNPRYRVKVELVRRWLVKKHSLQREIWELEKLNPQAHRNYEKALELNQQRDILNKLQLCKQALEINPNHFGALFEVAHTYLQQKEFERAIDHYNRAYKVEPLRAKNGYVEALLGYRDLVQKRIGKLSIDNFTKILELDHNNDEEIQELLKSIKSVLRITFNPYKGLFAFQEEDAPLFFGRGSFTYKLEESVRTTPLVAVIGASGSGKSSLVFAGLIPRLRSQQTWLIDSFRPGGRPLYHLAAKLVPLLESQMSKTAQILEVEKLVNVLQQGNLSLPDVLKRILEKNSGNRLLLVADQFEELYTLCYDKSERQVFLDQILAALTTTPLFNLVITLRADFLGYALSYRPFADALQGANVMSLGPMNLEELREAIAKPAEVMRVRIEEGLTERILNDSAYSPGNLPLLEFTLTQLWSKQRDGLLTHQGYVEIGGVEAALANHAEALFAQLSEPEKKRAQRVFIQLVHPGEETEDTRRLATRTELGEENWGLVTWLASSRLVVTGLNTATGEETVEMVSDALIRRWGRLRSWIELERDFLIWRNTLRTASHQWEYAGRDDGALLRGIPLVMAEEWLKLRVDELSPVEQKFIVLSLAQRNRERKERDRLRRQTIYGLSSGIVVALMLAFIAASQWQKANEQRLLLIRLKEESFSVTFSPQGKYLVTKSLDKTAKVFNASNGREVLRLENTNSVAISPDSNILASAEAGKVIGLWNLNTGKLIRSLSGSSGEIYSVAISPDGKTLVSGGSEKIIIIWDVNTGKLRRTITDSSSTITSIAINPNGQSFASTSIDKTTKIWDLRTGNLLKTIIETSEGISR